MKAFFLTFFTFSFCIISTSSYAEQTISTSLSSIDSTRMMSENLNRSGTNAIKYILDRLKTQQDDSSVQYSLVQAHDSRLAIQGIFIPSRMSEDTLVIKMDNDRAKWTIKGFITQRPGLFIYRDAPSGEKIYSIYHDSEMVGFKSKFSGLYASVSKYKVSYDFKYRYFVKGFGSQIHNMSAFESRIKIFLDQIVNYMTTD